MSFGFQPSDKMHHEVEQTAMAGVFNPRDVFQ
jgi:hypothetical protein